MLYAEDEITQAPIIPEERLREILNQQYGIVKGDLQSLTGYEDCNTRLVNVEWSGRRDGLEAPEQIIVKVSGLFHSVDGNVSKKLLDKFMNVTNPIEAKDTSIIDAQCDLCDLLREAGIPCPSPVLTLNGHTWTQEEIVPEVSLPFRVYHVLPGTNLENHDYTESLTRGIGVMIARVHKVFDKFDHPPAHVPFIALENVLCIKREVEKLSQRNIINCDQKKLVGDAIEDLQQTVFDFRDDFEEGLIHSDINETNLLISEKGEISGLLDFGDMHASLRVFDVAAAVLYLHLSDRLDQSLKILHDWLLAGYRTERELSKREEAVMLVSMRARLACSLVYGLRTARINYRGGSLEYILKTQSNGWQVLEKLGRMTDIGH